MNIKNLTEKKQRLDNYRPLAKELVHNLNDWFRIELTYTSNALEGNTLTRQETAQVVEKGIAIGGKSLNENLEAINHAKAFDWIKNCASQPRLITEKDILAIHALILNGIDDSNAGFYRRVSVRISGSTVILPNPLKVPDMMIDFIKLLQKTKDLHPVELAAEAHYRLVTIHPFIDGNGRSARLLMNLILIMHDYPPAIIRKTDRLAYINSLEKAQLGGSKDDYFKIIIKAVERSLDIYLNAVDGSNLILKDNNAQLLKIGELARKTNESTSTIRYWTKQQLLDVAEVTASGYQLYNLDMVNRIKQINQLKKKRYTLEEIKEKLNRI